MKTIYYIVTCLLLSFLFSCSLFRQEKTQIVTGFDRSSYLECCPNVEFISTIPKSNVFVYSNGQKELIGACSNCTQIAADDYGKYAIPEGALSACGGWWAGNSDYYYLYCDEGEVQLFSASFLSKNQDLSNISWRLIRTWQI